MSVKIIIADDYDAIRQAQRGILETEPDFEIVGEARNGREVIQLVEQSAPDVVIMDVNMPELNGIEATRWLRRSYAQVKVIAFSSHAEEGHVLAMLKSGASGYVLKPPPVNELIRAIRAVLNGQTFVSQGLHGILLDEMLRIDEKKRAM